MGVTTVQTPKSIVAEKGRKQLVSVVSAERGQLVILVCTINAIRNSIPSLFIFPRVRYKNYFIIESPTGSCGAASRSGWINEEIFCDVYLSHLIKHSRCSKEKQIFLLLDNHESHVSLNIIDICRNNGINIRTYNSTPCGSQDAATRCSCIWSH